MSDTILGKKEELVQYSMCRAIVFARGKEDLFFSLLSLQFTYAKYYEVISHGRAIFCSPETGVNDTHVKSSIANQSLLLLQGCFSCFSLGQQTSYCFGEWKKIVPPQSSLCTLFKRSSRRGGTERNKRSTTVSWRSSEERRTSDQAKKRHHLCRSRQGR